jgi:hypothetical protein
MAVAGEAHGSFVGGHFLLHDEVSQLNMTLTAEIRRAVSPRTIRDNSLHIG